MTQCSDLVVGYLCAHHEDALVVRHGSTVVATRRKAEVLRIFFCPSSGLDRRPRAQSATHLTPHLEETRVKTMLIKLGIRSGSAKVWQADSAAVS